MKQLEAIFFLAWNLLALLWEKTVAKMKGERRGREQFLLQFQEDGLWELSSEQRACANEHGKCFHCGICESIFFSSIDMKSLQEQGYQAPTPQMIFLGASRDLSVWPQMKERREWNADLWMQHGKTLTKLCPAGCSFEEMQEIFMQLEQAQSEKD